MVFFVSQQVVLQNLDSGIGSHKLTLKLRNLLIYIS